MKLLTLALLFSFLPVTDNTWPGFRGDGNGRTTVSLPVSWSPEKGIDWKVELPGYGQSSPVIWKNQVFVAAVKGDEQQELLAIAYDLKSGRQLWQKTFSASQKMKNNNFMSRAAGTPVVDGTGVYFLFGSGNLIKLSHAGETVWQRDLVKDYGKIDNRHGAGSSLAQTGNAVVVLMDQLANSYLLAVDKKTGKNTWKVNRDTKASWSTPLITEYGGKELVVVSSAGTVIIYDAADGSELWKMTGLAGNNIPSATADGEFIVLGGSESRFTPDASAVAKANGCIKMGMKDSAITFEFLWQPRKVKTSTSSPLVYEGHVYSVNKVGLLTCLDLKSGKEVATQRLEGDGTWASAIANQKHIYFFGKNGITTVIKAGPKLEIVAQNVLWTAESKPEKTPAKQEKGNEGAGSYDDLDPLVYGVAAVQGRLVFRTGTQLICVIESKK